MPQKVKVEITIDLTAIEVREFLQRLGGLRGVRHVRVLDETGRGPEDPSKVLPNGQRLLDV